MERIIGGKYKLGRKIGGGSFGEIFLATHVDSFEIVAVKIENSKTKHPRLLYEAKLYRVLEGGSMWDSRDKMVWSGWNRECFSDGFARAKSRRPVRLMWEEVLSKDSLAVS